MSASGAQDPLDAGAFAAWLRDMRASLRGERDADVPCGDCTACCTSSQFVPIGPHEHDALAHIPGELLFPAPRLPRGHVLLGYDEQGRCPMLVDGHCSIYEHRPRTCRTYDCRIFPAADIALDDASKALIATRIARWRFAHPSAVDQAAHDAVRDEARALARDGSGRGATEIAVRAVEAVDPDALIHPPPGVD